MYLLVLRLQWLIPWVFSASGRLDHLPRIPPTQILSARPPSTHPDPFPQGPLEDPITVHQGASEEHRRPPGMAVQDGLVGGCYLVEGDRREDGQEQVWVGIAGRFWGFKWNVRIEYVFCTMTVPSAHDVYIAHCTLDFRTKLSHARFVKAETWM